LSWRVTGNHYPGNPGSNLSRPNRRRLLYVGLPRPAKRPRSWQQQEDRQPSATGADSASQHHQAKAGEKRAIEQRTSLGTLPSRKVGWDGYVVQASPVIKELGPHLDRQAGMGKLGGQTGYKSVSQQQSEQGYSHQPG
jgi:hypothetical protein